MGNFKKQKYWWFTKYFWCSDYCSLLRPATARDHQLFLPQTRDRPRPPATARDRPRPPATARDFCGSPGCRGCPGLPLQQPPLFWKTCCKGGPGPPYNDFAGHPWVFLAQDPHYNACCKGGPGLPLQHITQLFGGRCGDGGSGTLTITSTYFGIRCETETGGCGGKWFTLEVWGLGTSYLDRGVRDVTPQSLLAPSESH